MKATKASGQRGQLTPLTSKELGRRYYILPFCPPSYQREDVFRHLIVQNRRQNGMPNTRVCAVSYVITSLLVDISRRASKLISK